MTRTRWLAWGDLWWPTVYAVAVLVVSTWAEAPQMSGDPARAWASIPVGTGFAVTAAVLWHSRDQRGNALIFQLFALSWVCGRLSYRGVGGLSVVCELAAAEVDVLAVASLLRYPSPRLERVDRVFVQVSALLAVTLQLPVVLASSRSDLGLLPDSGWPDLWHDPGLADTFTTVRGVWLGLSAVVFLGLLIRRWRRLVPLERRVLAPILVAAALGGACAVPLTFRGLLGPAARDAIYLARAWVTLLVCLSFLVSAIQLLATRTALLRLVARLGAEGGGPGGVAGVQDALREALIDPRLEVWYHLPESAGYVDGAGVRREPPGPDDGRLFLTTQTADGAPLAAVVADHGLQRHRTLVDAAVTISRFALENARLEAGLRAQLLAVREARARLVSTGLEERRRLERDLHDGAQQRLLAVTMRLSAIEARADPATSTAVGAVRAELHVALEELRDLARGIHPAVLTQGGLAPALEAVVEGLPLPIASRVPGRRWPPDVASAAYLVACAALTNVVRHAGPCRVDLLVEQVGDELHLRVADDGAGSEVVTGPEALRTMRDRVGALGGRLTVASRLGEGTVLEAWLPCA